MEPSREGHEMKQSTPEFDPADCVELSAKEVARREAGCFDLPQGHAWPYEEVELGELLGVPIRQLDGVRPVHVDCSILHEGSWRDTFLSFDPTVKVLVRKR